VDAPTRKMPGRKGRVISVREKVAEGEVYGVDGDFQDSGMR